MLLLALPNWNYSSVVAIDPIQVRVSTQLNIMTLHNFYTKSIYHTNHLCLKKQTSWNWLYEPFEYVLNPELIYKFLLVLIEDF